MLLQKKTCEALDWTYSGGCVGHGCLVHGAPPCCRCCDGRKQDKPLPCGRGLSAPAGTGLFGFDLKIVLDCESAGHAIGTYARNVLIAFIGNHTLKPDMAVLHDDVDRRQCLEAISG